ncbi:PAS domain-containing sensor histidine kinase [Croceiramulus getboli]|nr:PAS domain-containing sensor histidine kinase [Flavobacteriaceae bacterium YJPT1-3]
MKFFEKSIEEAFLILFEGASEGIVVVNSAQVIVATNESARTIFGYREKELEGKPLNILIPDKYEQAHRHHFEDFMHHSKKRRMGHGRDLYGVRKDGTTFPVEAGLNPFVLHNHRYVMALVSDITLRKKQEREILELNEHLEERIEKRTHTLNETVSQLKEEVALRLEAENNAKEALRREKELNELKTKFLSLVSHEFKTPLSGIASSASLAAKYTKEEQQEKREKHFKTIQSKVKYLNTIIDDFLSIERLDSNKTTYRYTRFPLSQVLDEVVYDAQVHLKQGQQINYPKNAEEFELEFDAKILELVLKNLLHNALKYSRENSQVTLNISEQEEYIKLDITDEGIGIPQEEQKFIFDRYFRAANVLTTAGTGIGLNIVKSHIENLGGEISFTSQEGEGSTFTILIPYKNH